MRTFQGTLVALATPFSNGALDEAAYRRLIQYQLANGSDGLVPIGTTGEAVTLTADERKACVKWAVEEAKGKVPVVAGAGSNSTRETIAAVAMAREVGADGALIVTPYYNKPPQAGLVEHFRQVAQAHPGFPLVAYNVPGRTGVDLLPETCQRLCDIPEVVALKDATAKMSQAIETLALCGDRLTLLSGDDFTLLPLIACGGQGCISVSANVAPRKVADLVAAARAGELSKARALQRELLALHTLLFVESNPIPVKAALAMMKRFGPELRPPLVPMTAGNAQKLQAELGRLGLI